MEPAVGQRYGVIIIIIVMIVNPSGAQTRVMYVCRLMQFTQISLGELYRQRIDWLAVSFQPRTSRTARVRVCRENDTLILNNSLWNVPDRDSIILVLTPKHVKHIEIDRFCIFYFIIIEEMEIVSEIIYFVIMLIFRCYLFIFIISH